MLEKALLLFFGLSTVWQNMSSDLRFLKPELEFVILFSLIETSVSNKD